MVGNGFTAALALGFATHKLKLSPIVGYLLAGILVGPFTPGYVADNAIAAQFAEIGVILLMFGVGLHFHLKDLLAVRRIAIPGAIFQSQSQAPWEQSSRECSGGHGQQESQGRRPSRGFLVMWRARSVAAMPRPQSLRASVPIADPEKTVATTAFVARNVLSGALSSDHGS
jgi:hypothetical protein